MVGTGGDLPAGSLGGPDVRWRAVLAAVPDLMLALNTELTLVYASPRAPELLGEPADELVGRGLAGWVHEDDLGSLVRELGMVLDRGSRARVTFRVSRPGTDPRWLESTAAPLRPPADALSGLPGLPGPPPGWQLLMACRDAGAQVRLGHHGIVGDLRFAALADSLSEGVVVLDPDGRVESCTPKAVRLLGWPADALLGRDPFAVAMLQDENGRPIRWSAPEQTVVDRWCSGVRSDGRRVMLRLRIRALPAPGGPGPGAMLVIDEEVGHRESTGGWAAGRLAIARLRGAAGLSRREGEILDLLAEGENLATIALRLHLSQHTVRGHVKALMLKFGVHTQLQAVVWAARHGLVDISGR